MVDQELTAKKVVAIVALTGTAYCGFLAIFWTGLLADMSLLSSSIVGLLYVLGIIVLLIFWKLKRG